MMGKLNLTKAALENVEETGCDPEDDIAALLDGRHTEESLLEFCLDGAGEDREEGWNEYVSAVASVVADRKMAAIIDALSRAGYDTQTTGTGNVYISDLAPEVEDFEDTAPGTPWDEECDAIEAAVLAIVAPLGGTVSWSDNDLHIEVA
jgi:hypothetical protein